MIKKLIENDIRYLRGWLLPWCGLLGTILLSFVLLRSDLGWNIDYWGFLRIALLLGFLLQLLFQLLLVTKIVQKESLRNPCAYWLTRPIPRQCLPPAKWSTLFIVVVLPQLLQAALMGFCFPGGWEGAWAGVRAIALISLLICFLGMLCASLTKDPGPALLTLIFMPFTLMIGGAALMRIPSLGELLTGFFYRVIGTPYAVWVLAAVGIVLGLWSFAREYHAPGGRWAHRSRCLISFVLLFMASASVPVRSLPERLLSESTIEPPTDAELKVVGELRFGRTDRPFPGARSGSSGSDLQTWLEGGPGSSYELDGQVEWTGLPDGWLPVVRSLRSYDPGGRLLPPGERSRALNTDHIPYAFARTLFPGIPADGPVREVRYKHEFFSSPLLDARSLNLPETFTTVFATRFYKGEKVRLPLESDARIQLAKTRLRLLSVDRLGRDFTLRFLFLSAGSKGRSIGETVEGGFLVLRNPQTGQVAFGERGSGSSSYVFNLLSTGDFEIRFPGFSGSENLSDLELYHVRMEPLGTHVRAVDYLLSEDG